MPLSTLQESPRGVPCKTRGQDGFATSFPVGLLHPLQHAGLARRSPDSPSLARNHVTANGIREKKQPKAVVASSIQVDARMPTALRKERFRVAHLEDVANSTALVGRMLIVGLHDTITNPVAQIAGLLESSIE